MTSKKRLSKRQITVMDDLFSGQYDEQAVLEKHKLSRGVYNKWLVDELFAEEFSRRINVAHHQSQFLIAKYSSMAAARLIQLTNSEKEETARKACLDIINLPQAGKSDITPSDNSPCEKAPPELSLETAGRLLATLAEEKKQKAQ